MEIEEEKEKETVIVEPLKPVKPEREPAPEPVKVPAREREKVPA